VIVGLLVIASPGLAASRSAWRRGRDARRLVMWSTPAVAQCCSPGWRGRLQALTRITGHYADRLQDGCCNCRASPRLEVAARSLKRHRPRLRNRGPGGNKPRPPLDHVSGTQAGVLGDLFMSHHDITTTIRASAAARCWNADLLGRDRRASGTVTGRRSPLRAGSSAQRPPTGGMTFLQACAACRFDKPAQSQQRLVTLEEASTGPKAIPPSLSFHESTRRHHPSVEGRGIDNHVPRAYTSRRPNSDVQLRAGRALTHDEEVELYRRYGKGTRGRRWYSSTPAASLLGLVMSSTSGRGPRNLGYEQLEWPRYTKGNSKSTPTCCFAHIPLWTVYPQWGWCTETAGPLAEYVGFGSVRS